MNPLCIPWNHQTSQRVPPISFTVKKSAKKWPSFGDQRASALHDVPLRCATLAPFLLGGAVKPYETWRKRMAPMGLCIKYIPPCYSQVLNPFYDGNNPNDTIISIMFLGALGASGRPGGQHAQAGRSSPQWHCAPAPAWSEKNGGDESSARRRPNAHVFSTWEEGWPGWPPTYPTPKYPKCIRKFHVNSMRVHSLAFQSPAGNTALELPPAEYTNASANHQLELVLEISIYFCWWMDG